MSTKNDVIAVHDMHVDARVHVFRRTLDLPGEFEGMQVDSYVVMTEQYVVVLDTMLCPEDMANVMRSIEDDIQGRQVLVVDSHADWDHCWGNNYFTGEHRTSIIAHDYCRVRMESEEEAEGLREYQQRFPVFRNVQLVAPTLTFNETFTIHGGDVTIQLLSAPGHHPDQIAAWIPELQLVLAFDAVEMPIPIVQDAASVPSMLATLERLRDLHPVTVLCSHGKTTSPQLINENLAYFQNIEQRARTLLDARPNHSLTQQELERPAELLKFPFASVIANITEPVDTAFYTSVHDGNMRAVLEWVMSGERV